MCNIFIALISLGDVLHSLAHYAMITSYKVKEYRKQFDMIFLIMLGRRLLGFNSTRTITINLTTDRNPTAPSKKTQLFQRRNI
ncbi:hypothetical protein KIN20_031603 [Parelaphostrongylus tenuis]|uniref:Secreted protein n=1 Tax=Parelaphostrongylus tenuis TaxID=148309 RepID=A0AAD5WGX3_PARTN|nr:hypothetical protein KIN20_031603 [Parelaphostrongylus tenuis]